MSTSFSTLSNTCCQSDQVMLDDTISDLPAINPLKVIYPDITPILVSQDGTYTPGILTASIFERKRVLKEYC